MAAHSVTHPSAVALRAFALGKVNDNAAAALLNHLDGCPDCCKQVAAMSGDDFLDRLRQVRSQSSTSTPALALSETAGGPKASANRSPLANLPPELAANQQYEILRELGRGGMGVVYLAKNKLMDRLEVLKVVNKVLLDHPGAIERFLREIRSAAKLSHANVVGAYSAVQQGELLAFAMEYIEGQDLASVVKAKGPLPIPHACYYVQQAAHGLQHAYDKGMVHRDIKPQNLILAREGKKHIVKVLDFGLAKVMREKSDDTGLTGEGRMLGTPDYIAPEQTMDAAHADIRADIYSLGCTLYYLLSGHPPFSGSSLGAILVAHQMHEAQPLNLVRPEVPEELAAVVRKMMAKTPAKRYQTPLDVVQALAPFVKQGATPKPSPELSVGTVGAKPAVKKAAPIAPPPVPTAEAPKKQPAPAAVWESLTEGEGASIGPRKSAAIGTRRAATVRERTSRKKWLIGGSIGVGVLLLSLLGMWAGGVFKVKTADGLLIIEVNEPNPNVYVDDEIVTLTWDNGGKKAEIRVKSGTHKVEVKKDGFSVDGRELTFKDGDRVIFTAQLLPAKREKRAEAPPPPLDTKKPDAPRVDRSTEGFTSLFNGKDLSGWEKMGNSNYQWQVIDGKLVGRWTGANTYGGATLGTQRSDYQNFRFRVETMPGQDWAFSLVFLWLRKGDRNRWCKANIGTVTGRDEEQTGVLQVHSAIMSPKPPIRLQANEWLTQEVVVEGKRIRVFVNNVLASEYLLAEQPAPGRLGITVGGGVKIRKIEVQELPPPAAPPVAADGFVPLFNGKDLTGWKTHSSQPGNWRVENGILIGSGNGTSHLYTERGDWQNFHLRMEARLSNGGNSGVYFRAPFGPSIPSGSGQPTWVRGYNAKFDMPRFGGLLIDDLPLVRIRNIPAMLDVWVKFEVMIEGNHLTVKMNGDITAEYTDGKSRYSKGHIVLQQHAPAKAVEFRTINIKELPATKAELPPPVKEKDFVPLFNGKDLTGWKVFGGGTGSWKVVDGAIVSSGRLSHLFSERGDYENFHFRIEAMIDDGGNSGQYFRAQFGPRFPAGYEAQINCTGRDVVRTGSLYGIANISEILHQPNEWFRQEVIAQGDHIVIKVNGKTAVDTHDSRYKRGHFALQQHNSATVVKFRRIEVKELPVEPSPNSAANNFPAEAREAAKAYQKACAEARTKFLAEFDTAAERLEKMKGPPELQSKLIQAVKAEKKRFEDKRLIPWSEPMRPYLAKYFNALGAAEEKLRRSYSSLAIVLHKAKKESVIADLQADLANLIGVRLLAKWRVLRNGRQPGWVACLYSNGRIYGINGNATKGTWSYSNGVLTFRWPDPKAPGGAWLDSSNVSADGTTYAGTNNAPPAMRARFTGSYLNDD